MVKTGSVFINVFSTFFENAPHEINRFGQMHSAPPLSRDDDAGCVIELQVSPGTHLRVALVLPKSSSMRTITALFYDTSASNAYHAVVTVLDDPCPTSGREITIDHTRARAHIHGRP